MMLRWRLDRGITTQMNILKKGFTEVHCIWYMYMYIHVLMRDERRKEERSKQDQT